MNGTMFAGALVDQAVVRRCSARSLSMADEVRGAKPIVGDYSAASKASCRATVRLEDMADLKLLGLPNGFGFLPFPSIAAPAMSDTRQAADLDDEPGVPLDHQRHAVPAGDDVAVDRPLQHLLTLGDRELPERAFPIPSARHRPRCRSPGRRAGPLRHGPARRAAPLRIRPCGR